MDPLTEIDPAPASTWPSLGEPRPTSLPRRTLAALVAAVVSLGACGTSDGDAVVDQPVVTSDASTPETAPPTTLQQNGTVVVTGTALPPFDNTVPDDSIGTPAPVVQGETFEGVPISIGEATGNPSMLVFVAHWCPHCNDEIPELLQLQAEGSIPADLDVIAVSTAVDDSAPNYPPSDWLDDIGWEWPSMADDGDLSAIAAYGGTSFPFTVILDGDGNVLARRTGQASAADSLAFINDALG